jgi:hypothetical protein
VSGEPRRTIGGAKWGEGRGEVFRCTKIGFTGRTGFFSPHIANARKQLLPGVAAGILACRGAGHLCPAEITANCGQRTKSLGALLAFAANPSGKLPEVPDLTKL